MSIHLTRRAAAAAALLLLTCSAAPLCADTNTGPAPLEQVLVPLKFDTGSVSTAGNARGVAYTGIVSVPGRPWLRLQFDDAELGGAPSGGQPTVLRITSLLDGATQLLNTRTLREWSSTSAYFNGDALLIEVIADPGARPSRLTMSHIITGSEHEMDEGSVATICFGADDRIPSAEAANGRQLPLGCTTWIFNDPQRSFLTAGHCAPAPASVVQFNVPPSTSNGTLVNPPPEDQYVIDESSVQFSNNGVGQDWCYYGCFPNSVTGMTPSQAQGAYYTLAHMAPELDDPAQLTRVTGYGSVFPPSAPELNQVQQTHTGPYFGFAETIVAYQVDTTSGNSGSPVVDLASGLAIGIHTHSGCLETGGANQGTVVQTASLQHALAHPLGVCVPNAGIEFNFPNGVPTALNPGGATMRVEVLAAHGETPAPNTAVLHVDIGAGFVALPMTPVSPNVYDAVFPPIPCGTPVRFYVQAQSDAGRVAYQPATSPNTAFDAISANALDLPLDDNFQTDQGWTVSNSAGLTTGTWQRAIPTAPDARAPHSDADGSGFCYVTDNANTADIDGGSTTLTSPAFDATVPNATLSYWRWFVTSSADTIDALRVEVSADDGGPWVLVEEFSSMGVGWNHKEWPVAQIAGITPSTHFRVRFKASDLGTGSNVEAAIDGVRVTGTECSAPCPADLTGDGAVDGADLGALLGNWGNAGTGDLTNDGTVDGADLGQLLGAWGACSR